MAAQVHYGFPILQPEVIIETLAQYSINVRPGQLKTPTAEFMMSTCTQVVQKITGITEAALSGLADEVLEAQDFAYPDLYRGTVNKLAMSMQIARLARAAAVKDYSSRDLAMPEPGRTITLLSAFCNYFAHCQAQSDAVQQVRDEAYTARDTLVKAAKKAAEAEQAVAKLRAEHAREHAQQAALQAEVRSVEAKVVEKGAERAEGEKELKEAKERKEALVKEKETLTEQRNHLQEQIHTTKSQIVQSPDRIRRSISQLTASTASMRKELAATDAKIRDLQAKQPLFVTIEQDLLACIEHLDEIKTEAEALATAEKVFQETEHKLGKADVQKRTLQLELETVTLQLESVQERLERMERLQQERRSTTAQTLERLQTESAQLELERQENNVELTQLHSQADALEQGMQARLEREGEEMNELLATYWALRQQIEVYMDDMSNTLDLSLE